MRTTILTLVVVGLAAAVWLFWPDSSETDTTVADAATTTTATTEPEPASSTTIAASTTSSQADSHVVETVEEAEEILRELWFGWFEGIYNQDEDRIREVVATQHQFGLAVDQFGQMTFSRAPGPSDIEYIDTEILFAGEDCTAIWTTATISGFTSGSTSDVHVLRWEDGWKFFSVWSFRNDRWEADCEAQLGL